jgi:hypothetical protein
LVTGMAFLADSRAPCPPLPTRLAQLSERIDWPTVASLVVILATILLQTALMVAERPSLDTGVCERRVSAFFPPLH